MKSKSKPTPKLLTPKFLARVTALPTSKMYYYSLLGPLIIISIAVFPVTTSVSVDGEIDRETIRHIL